MKRGFTLVVIGLLALSMISCNLISRLAGKAKETAEAAVTSVVATVASLPTATPETNAETAPTATTAAVEETAPTATTEAETADDQPGEPAEIDSLDNLKSYRADWTTAVKMPGQDESSILKYKLEWVKDPPAQHIWMDMDSGSFSEVIWVEDKVWLKVGEQWTTSGAEITEQAFENFHDALKIDDDMELVGTETVNGMRSKHYLYEAENVPQGARVKREIWVADEGNLPPVPVRALFLLEIKSTQGTMTTEVEAHIFDINTPIEIKAPE